jgi:excisionase family DNA binding protein
MTSDELSQWMTAQEAAQQTGYSVSHIGSLRRDGKIMAVKMGHDYLYKRDDVQNLPPRNKAGRKQKSEGEG